MDSAPRFPGDADPLQLRRTLYWVAALAIILAIGIFGWRRHQRRARGSAAQQPVATLPSGIPSVIEPTGPAAQELALEVWIKSPEAMAARIVPKLMGPNPPLSALIPSFAQLLKNGMPKESQGDIDDLDFDKPLGYTLLEGGLDGQSRFVWAAAVKDPVHAAKTIESYATREGAAKEHSTVLNTEMYRGSKTGRYLALVGKQAMFASDKAALETSAARLASGFVIASTQAHDLVAHAPRSWIAGPFAKQVERTWVEWSAPQLGGATTGPAKALFDEVAGAAKSTWTGAEDLQVVFDVGDTAATGLVVLRAAEGSAFAKFLSEYPTASPEVVLNAPRDALGAMTLQFPPAWLETFRKFLVTPPPGVAIPEDLRLKTETVFTQIASVLEGEVLVSSVADPLPNPGPGGSLLRFKVRDEEKAKKAARDLATFILPQGLPVTAITVEGGSGEAMEFQPAAQPPQPPMPPVGLAWAVRGGYLYIVRGSYPKLRIARFANSKTEDHLGHDADVKGRVVKLPGRSAGVVVIAPLRADTPLAGAMGVPAMAQALTFALEPTTKGLVLHASLDLELALNVIAPLFVRGPGGGQPGAPGGLPPGSLPPDSATGVPQQPGQPGQPAQPGMVPTQPPKPPKQPGGPPPAVTKTPPLVIPPAPTGYVLPIPKPGGGGY